jgi:hypothetical protein
MVPGLPGPLLTIAPLAPRSRPARAPLGGAEWLAAIFLTCGMIFADYAADCTQGRVDGSVESGKVVHLFQLFGLARCCKHGPWGYIGWVETDLGD